MVHWMLELAWSVSLFKPFENSLVEGWSWFETFALIKYLNKACWRLGLDWTILLLKSFKKVLIGVWSWLEA